MLGGAEGCCIINPSKNGGFSRNDATLTSFIPMELVDEVRGKLKTLGLRPFEKIKKGYTYFEEGDILFAKITPCMQNGKCAIAKGLKDGIGYGTTEFHVVRPKVDKVIGEWIHFFMRSAEFRADAEAAFEGSAGQQRVPVDFLENYLIPLPPLSEQKTIAHRLDRQMQDVDRMRQAAEEQLEAVKLTRGSISRAVFESESAVSWEQVELKELCQLITDGTHVTPTYVSKGIPFISVKDIRETGISFENTRFISLEEHTELTKRCHPTLGDVLYTKVGTTGIAKTVDTEKEFSIFVSVALLKPKRDRVIPEYLECVLNSPLGREQADAMTQGAGNQNLVLDDIETIQIPLAPYDLQPKIVQLLRDKFVETERLFAIAKEQLDAINTLPSAYLREVFGMIAADDLEDEME